jgi:hypothetical protein
VRKKKNWWPFKKNQNSKVKNQNYNSKIKSCHAELVSASPIKSSGDPEISLPCRQTSSGWHFLLIPLILTILTFIALLSVLIFVHELGHFLAARKVGIRVEEFAFGLPFTKPLISKTYKNLKLSIYPILFGGFVKLYGEEQTEQGDEEKQRGAFFAKSKLARTFVILAGVAMNFLLGIIVISFIFTQGVWVPQPGVLITKVLKN